MRNAFQERVAPKPIEIDIEKLHMKFLALNVDFEGLSLDFLGSGKLAQESTKKRFTFVGQSFAKTVADRHGHATYHNKR